jgi:ElaB/YqjD/DUF883 family membrane-anchored ribosome-binding protein
MSRYPAYAREFAEVERRMQRLEQRLDQLGGMASRTARSGVTTAAQATDRVGEAVVAALGDLVDRFRGGARGVGGEAARFGQDAARFSQEATKLGGQALRRVSTEVERRPLLTVAIAVGVGLLIGLGGSLGSRRR